MVVFIILLFLEFGAKYALYNYALYRSYKLTKDYYRIEGGYSSFKKQYEQVVLKTFQAPIPIIEDFYNRLFYLPKVTGHNFGFNDSSPTIKRAPGVIRILCIESSTTESGYPDPLQKLLNKMRPGKFEVINAGIPKSSILNAFMNYSLTWRQLHPDIVIIENMVDEVLWNTIPFTISNRFEKPISDIVMAQTGDSIHGKFALCETILRTSKYMKYIMNKTLLLDSPTQDGLKRFSILLESSILIIQTSGADVILLTYQPALSTQDLRGHFSPDFLSQAFVYYQSFFFNFSIKGALETIEAQNSIMRDMASRLSITIIDTYDRIPREDDYFEDGTHQSEKGNLLVAKIIAENLL